MNEIINKGPANILFVDIAELDTGHLDHQLKRKITFFFLMEETNIPKDLGK